MKHLYFIAPLLCCHVALLPLPSSLQNCLAAIIAAAVTKVLCLMPRLACAIFSLCSAQPLSQEYLGSYVPDEHGRLVFREGALVTAVRQGQWVVLDELNLAPSEVLEALNR